MKRCERCEGCGATSEIPRDLGPRDFECPYCGRVLMRFIMTVPWSVAYGLKLRGILK